MNFFQQLAETGDVDLTLRIMSKNGQFTMNIMPGSSTSHTKPIIVNGSPQDLDEGFFSTILPGVNEVKGLVTNLDDVKKEASEKSAAKEKAPAKEKGASSKKNQADKIKVVAKKNETKTEEPEEAPLFE